MIGNEQFCVFDPKVRREQLLRLLFDSMMPEMIRPSNNRGKQERKSHTHTDRREHSIRARQNKEGRVSFSIFISISRSAPSSISMPYMALINNATPTSGKDYDCTHIHAHTHILSPRHSQTTHPVCSSNTSPGRLWKFR